jgi:hypothetical protein
MIDILLIGVVALVAWLVSSEGAHGAGVVLVATVLAGLLAMNFFEPVANLLSSSIPGYDRYMDLVSLLGLFALFVSVFRLGSEQILPIQIEVVGTLYEPLRWIFAAATGYVTMCILCTALHTAPLPRDFIGFSPERKNLLQMAAPDRQWLGFVQYVSEKNLFNSRLFDAPKYQAPGTLESREWSSFPIRYATRRAAGSRPFGAGQPGINLGEPAAGGGSSPAPPPGGSPPATPVAL